MALFKQILLSLVVIVLAAGGWYVYQHRDGLFGAGETVAEAGATTGQGPGKQGAGAGTGAPGAGGRQARGFGGPPLVVTAVVTTDSSGAEVRAIGTLAAAKAITLFAQVTGIVSAVDFKQGAKVDEGQVLLRIDDADQQVAVDRAQVALANATAARERTERLAKTSNATTVQLTDAQTAEKQAQIDLRSAQLELAKRQVKAPFAGTTGLTDVAVGDLINSTRAITTLDELTTLKVAFDVPERVSSLIKAGEQISATSDTLPGQTITGKIIAIDSRIDPNARTLKVQAEIPNDSGALKPGTAIVIVMSFTGAPRPSVPSLAVQWDRQGPFVWKVDGDVVHRTAVQILVRRSGMVTVASALAAGDHVVVEGVLRLREGLTVAQAGSGGGGAPEAGQPTAGGAASPRIEDAAAVVDRKT